jgi:hypothetical protein
MASRSARSSVRFSKLAASRITVGVEEPEPEREPGDPAVGGGHDFVDEDPHRVVVAGDSEVGVVAEDLVDGVEQVPGAAGGFFGPVG